MSKRNKSKNLRKPKRSNIKAILPKQPRSLESFSSEELGTILAQQYEKLMQINSNITNIKVILDRRQKKNKQEAEDKKDG